MKITEIFAHRGACGYEPENTMEAFALAVEQGADGIELDVQLTKDGKLVIFHDETIDRMCHGTGWVKDFTLEELRKYEVCSPEGKKGRIPTLREVLELVKPGNLKVNIELKTGIYWYPDIERLTVEEVKRQKMEERVIYSSFNHYSIQKLKEYAPEAETAYLYSDVILNVDEYAKKSGIQALHPALYHVLMADFLSEYKESGLKIRVWTVNEKEHIEALVREGADAIITNYPDRAVKIRDEFLKNTGDFNRKRQDR